MDQEKLNKPTEVSPNMSKHVGFHSKSGDSITEINQLASTSSLKPKKSCSLLSALVRRTKSKTKKIDQRIKTMKQPSNLRFITSNSSLGSRSSEELEIMLEKVENPKGTSVKDTKNRRDELSDSDQSLSSSIKIKRKFFSKFLKKHLMPEANKKKSKSLFAIECDQKLSQSVSEIKETLESTNQNTGVQFIPTSFVQLDKPNINSSLTQGLVSVQNLAVRLQQSEGYLLQIFTKYITDESLQKELVENLCLHSKLHLETERMNNVLSMEMCSKQIEIEKMQETALQDALNSVIRQNRQLQNEYELLFCTYERLLKKFKNFHEREMNSKSIIGYDSQVQDVIKHNSKLIHKVELLYHQIERLENELADFRKQNEGLEHQLTSSMTKYNELEAVFRRTRADYELEKATLNHQLKSKEKILINSIDACNKLKKDLDGMEDQFKDIPLTVDWNKLKCHEDGLSECIEFCRICINEMTKEMTTLRKQLCLKDKEIGMLSDTNGKLQEHLKKSTTDLDGLAKKIDDSDKLLVEHKCKCLEAEMKLMQEKFTRSIMEHEMEKNMLIQKMEEYEKLHNEKVAMIEQSNVYMSNLNSDNVNLRNQVENLNRLLRDTGSGDIVKEINMNHEQIHKLDFQCSQLMGEKQHLLSQLDFIREDHRKLSENQTTNNQQLEKLKCEIENMSRENGQLQQKYEAERNTVLSLQTERKKYLDEKALIKTFFHHMKSEINRLQKLEGTVTDISKEANKLAVVAEYNKQLGKKLKTEIQEKDKTIVKLRSSVEKLNDIHLKNAKEKLSLCSELSELCQMKEKLNSELSWEVQRNLALDGAKKEIAEHAHSQIQQYEEFHRKERTVLKDMLKDLKCVVNQRNSLLESRESLAQEAELLKKTKDQQAQQIEEQRKQIMEYQKQIEQYRKEIEEQHKNMEEQEKKIYEIDAVKIEFSEKLKELEEEQEDDKNKINSLQDRLITELTTYDDNIKQMEKLIFELRKEKGNMEDSIKYLQNNTQKLHNDLNLSRGNEKELKDALAQNLSDMSSLNEELQTKERQIESLNLEKEKLVNEINQVNLVCEKVLADFESCINCSIKKEEIYKIELRESQNALISVTKENNHLTKELTCIKEECDKVYDEFNNLKEQEQICNSLIQTIESKKEAFKDILNQNEKLEQNYSTLQSEYKMLNIDLVAARKECESLFIELDQKKEEITNLQNEIEDIEKKNMEMKLKKDQEINQLKLNINDLNQKLDNERSNYTGLSQIHKAVSTKFLKSIEDLAEEKNARQKAEATFKEIKESFDKLHFEKNNLHRQVNELLDELDATKKHINILTQEKEGCHYLMTQLQNKYDDILQQCVSLEAQIGEHQLSTDSDSEEIKLIQRENDRLKKDSEETHKIIMSLQKEIAELQQEITGLEFQKSEGTLRLHELQRKFETEHSLCLHLKTIQKVVLTEIVKLKNAGIVDQDNYNCLMNLIKNDSNPDVQDSEIF